MSSSDPRFDEILAGYLDADAAGRAALLAAHPEHAERMRRFDDNERWLRDAVAADATLDAMPQSPARLRYVGDYELLEEVARGAMGVVWRARQMSVNRVVAVKMILAGEAAGEAHLRRFRAEAEMAANLDHPNIVPVYEVGVHEGQPYFSMKLIEGRSLAAAMGELKGKPREIAALMAKVARAVHHAHQRGVLHRDLKPSNILLDGAGEPHVADFGLARRGDGAGSQSGAVIGTPAYMAPEQARAEKGLTVAADVWSLGAVLYELLSGRPPFSGGNALEVLSAVVGDEPAAVPGDLGTVALKCLSKEPGRRYESAVALADELERWLRGEPILARPVGPFGRLVRWVRREPVLASMGAAVVLALMLGVAVSSWFAVKADGERQAADRERLATARKADELAETTIDGLLLPLGRQAGPPDAAEVDAFRQMRELPAELLPRFVEKALASPEMARRVGVRADYVVAALVGLDRQRRRAVAEAVIAASAKAGTEGQTAMACAWFGLSLNITDAGFCGRGAETLAAMMSGESRNGLIHLAPALGAYAGRLDRAKAATLADSLAAALAEKTDPFQQAALAEALDAMVGRLGDAKATELAGKVTHALVSAMSKSEQGHELKRMAVVLLAMSGRLDAAGAARLPDPLAKVGSRTYERDELLPLGDALAGVAARLGAEEAARLAESLAESLTKATYSGHMDVLAKTLSSLSSQLDPANAAKVADFLVATMAVEFMKKKIRPVRLRGMAKALAALSARLDATKAASLADSLGAAMDKPSGHDGRRYQMGVALAAVSGRAHPARAAVLAGKAADELSRNVRWTEALAALAGRLDPAKAGRLAELFADTIAWTTDEIPLQEMAKALAALAARTETGPVLALLHLPHAGGEFQRELLAVLSARTRRHHPSVWHFLDWAEANGVDWLDGLPPMTRRNNAGPTSDDLIVPRAFLLRGGQ